MPEKGLVSPSMPARAGTWPAPESASCQAAAIAVEGTGVQAGATTAGRWLMQFGFSLVAVGDAANVQARVGLGGPDTMVRGIIIQEGLVPQVAYPLVSSRPA